MNGICRAKALVECRAKPSTPRQALHSARRRQLGVKSHGEVGPLAALLEVREEPWLLASARRSCFVGGFWGFAFGGEKSFADWAVEVRPSDEVVGATTRRSCRRVGKMGARGYEDAVSAHITEDVLSEGQDHWPLRVRHRLRKRFTSRRAGCQFVFYGTWWMAKCRALRS